MITNPISNIPVNKKSHVYGWSKKWADLLNVGINHKCDGNFDKVYIDHGVSFGGTLNLFGGANKDIFDKINRVMAIADVTSLDRDMPDYGAMLKSRIGASSTYEGITEEWCDKVSEKCKTIPSLKMEDMPIKGITVGDSHSIAFANKGDVIFRDDGKTLHGISRGNLSSMMRGIDAKNISVTFCFGSIDIRHHYLRNDNIQYMEDSIKRYVDQAFKITDDPWFSAPVPVEYEERRVPKTGWFKGTPFYGSLAERSGITEEFIDILSIASNDKVIHPPWEWYEMDPEKYAKTHMELNSSVHIAPPYYRSENWGQNEFIG